MRTYDSKTYFDTQSAALEIPFQAANDRGYDVEEPQHLWTEHVAYGTTVRYNIPLKVQKTGNYAKKWLHITLYRMDSGKYELTYYFN